MDSLAPIFARFNLTTRVFFTGVLCRNTDFYDQPHLGFVHLLRSGELTLVDATGTRTKLSEPAVVFFPGSSGHGLLANGKTRPDLVCATIDFGAAAGNPLVRALPAMLVLPLNAVAALGPTLEMLFAEADNHYDARQAALDRLAEYFVILLLRYAAASSALRRGWLAALADPRLGKALTALHANPERSWTLASLAKVASMSRARFAARFRELVGVPPLEYLTDWRLSIAQAMLKRGESPKWVAPAVGYASAATLSRALQKRPGHFSAQPSKTRGHPSKTGGVAA